MVKITIASISPNNYKFIKENFPTKVGGIEGFVDLHEIELSNYTDELMNLIADTIKLTAELDGDTTICYEDGTHIYQMCHLSMRNNLLKETEEENVFAGYLGVSQHKMFGSVVLIKQQIADDYTCKPCSITLGDVGKLYDKRTMYTGVKLVPNALVEEFRFHRSPEEILSDMTQYKVIDLPLFKFNFLLIVQIDAKPFELNKQMSRLMGCKILGTCYLVAKSSEYDYVDVGASLFNKLHTICLDTMESRKVAGESGDVGVGDKKESDVKKINGLQVVMNKYCLVDKRHKEFIKRDLQYPICNHCQRHVVGIHKHKKECCGDIMPLNLQLKQQQQREAVIAKAE